MKKTFLTFLVVVFAIVHSANAQNCPGYDNVAISASETCGNQIYYFEVQNNACNGTITFDVFGNYGDWSNEISWQIVSVLSGATVASGNGVGPADNSPFSQTVGPLDPAVHGNYFTITVFDSFGDGFNGGGFIQVDQGVYTWAYQDSGWSTDEWYMTFGTNIDISPSTISITTPSGVVTSTAPNCLDHEVELFLDNTNFCTPITIDLPWEITCDVTSAVLASGTKTVTVFPQVPTNSSDMVDITWNPTTCQWDVAPQNDCDVLDINNIFTISPDPTGLSANACQAGTENFTVTYLGISGGPDCCSTAGPLSPITYQNSETISGAIVQSSPFGGTNNSAYSVIPANGTGGDATSVTITVDMSGYCFDPPGTSGDDYWLTVYVDGVIIHDQMYSVPPTNLSETFTLADIPGGYNENSVVEVYLYPNSFSAGTPTVNTTYVPGIGCGSIGDGQWTMGGYDVTLDVTFEQMAPSPVVCDFPAAPAYVCCTPAMIPNDNGQVCSGTGTDDLATWQGNVTAANPNCLVFSSVTPLGGSTLPDNVFPNGINAGASQITQTVSAYSYCDANGNGSIDAGDTYTLLSTYDLIVDPIDNPSFSVTPACDGGTATISGTVGGTFSFDTPPGDGATIDPLTGTVTNGSPSTSYDILYTTAGTCPNSTVVTLTTLSTDDPTFTVAPTCDGGTASVSGTPGGTFSFGTAPGDGATIDPSTGTVTNGTPGATYDIQYATSGACAASSNQSLTALPLDDASFTVTPTCDGGTATVTGDPGGTFSFAVAPGDGATIDPSTGTVTNGTSGTSYNITYTTSNVCANSSTATLTANTVDDPTFAMTPTCDGGTASVSGTPGGTFSFNTPPGDAAVIDPSTGAITGGTPGATYDVLYATIGICAASSTQTVTALTQDDPTFSTTPTCDGGIASVSGTAGGTFTFTVAPADAAVIDGATGTVSNGTPGATYDITYTTSGVCPNSSSQTVTALAQDDPTFSMTQTCDGGTATVSGTAGGTFSFNTAPTDGAVIDPVTGTITGGTGGNTYDVLYTTSGVCPATSTQQVTSIVQDDATFSVTPTCDGGTATVTGTAGGTFSFATAPTDAAVIDPSTGVVTSGTPGATYDVTYTTNGTCPNSLTLQLTAIAQDDPTFTMAPTCDGGTASVSGTSGGTFTFNVAPGDGAVIDATSGTVSGGTSGGSYDVLYTTNGICPSSSVVSVVAYTTPPAPTAGVDSTYCLTWMIDPMNASGTGGTLNWYLDTTGVVIASGSSYVPDNSIGTTAYYVTETLNGCEGPASMVTITIEGCDITIPTAITPNGDLNNDTWEIVDLDITYPDNVVRVYNRWGNMIFEHISNNGATPYSQNQWDGTYEGNSLPVGSYYYIIEFNDLDNEVATGSVSIILD